MFLAEIWDAQPGSFFCVSSKTRSGKWEDHFFKRDRIRETKAFIEKHLDRDLYFCPHGFSRPRRLKDYAEIPSLLWADLDEVNPSKIKPMPSIAWESSPGRYACLWIVDRPITEDINRRLTYSLGADAGGWDITQVLRIPGTTNYKYSATPRVRLLWDDGPKYRLDEITRILPEEDREAPNMGEAIKIYKRYEKSLSRWARKELLHGKPQVGKRSEVLWRLNNELMEAGMTTEEAFLLLKNSPWNKFAGRRNGDEQLKRELEKAVTKKIEAAPVDREDKNEGHKYLVKSLSQVEEEQMNWVWYPYLARREVSIIEGDPGLGKSYLAQIIGKHIVDGEKLPTVKAHPRVKGNVVYFDIENSSATVSKRRLVDNGCKNLHLYYQEEGIFMVDDEDAMERVYEALERVKPVLVVFDTINTYIGKVDTHKSSETQQAFSNFRDIANRFNCAVLVVRHLTKSSKEKALYRGQGSIAFTGLARVVFTVGVHPEDAEMRVMAVTKLNFTKRPPALTFTIESLPDTLRYQDRSIFTWGEFVDLDTDEILSAAIPKKDTQLSKQIEEFLITILSDGPMRANDVMRAIEAKGFNIKSVRRVAKSIGIIISLRGKGESRTSTWSLPYREETTSEGSG